MLRCYERLLASIYLRNSQAIHRSGYKSNPATHPCRRYRRRRQVAKASHWTYSDPPAEPALAAINGVYWPAARRMLIARIAIVGRFPTRSGQESPVDSDCPLNRVAGLPTGCVGSWGPLAAAEGRAHRAECRASRGSAQLTRRRDHPPPGLHCRAACAQCTPRLNAAWQLHSEAAGWPRGRRLYSPRP